MIDDLEDDYAEYLADELGYACDARDDLRGPSLSEMLRHDELTESSAAELEALDPTSLNDLLRWGYARGCRRHGDIDGFLAAARLVVESDTPHGSILYDEVYESLIETLANHGLQDEADLLVERFAARWPDDTRAHRLAVFVGIRGQDLATRLESARGHLSADPERMFEIAEDLAQNGAVDPCGDWLRAVEERAEEMGLRALLLDIALLRADLATTE